MCSCSCSSSAANSQSSIRFLILSHAPPRRRRRRRRIINLSFPRKPTSKFIVFASKDNPKLDPWDQIEFKILGSSEKRSAANAPLETKLVDSNIKFSMEALLQGKPKRLDQPAKGMPNFSREDMALVNPEIYGNVVELENFLATSPIKEHEDNDWAMVEDLARTGGREEVKLISSSTRGFVVSFGSLIGFLPYCNLPARWKFLGFESWLRGKALDPSEYKQNLGVVGKYRIANKTSLDSSLGPEIDLKVDVHILPDMKLEDLLKIYDQEKLIFLSSFVGQKIKVYVASSDRKSKRLIFSVKPKEKEEMVEKKKSVMAKLSVGDVVKCCIKKITYFGIFVEVEGVTALIHPTQVSWDATLDHASYFRVGKIVKAKVHRLDFSLERIFLSLKETTPDPLIEGLGSWFIRHPCLRMNKSYLPDQETECNRTLFLSGVRFLEREKKLVKNEYRNKHFCYQIYQLSDNAVAVIGFGIWMSSHNDVCRKSLTLPVLGLGAVIFVMFIVTNNGSGHNVAGLRYKEYQLRDYSPWFLKQLNNTHNWEHLRSCLVKSDDCNNLPKKYKTLKQYKLAKLTPIEAGCCRPPSECGYPVINASYYDLSFHPISPDNDCKVYKNSKAIKCYNCDSCKAGVAQYMKTEWRVVAIFNDAVRDEMLQGTALKSETNMV
ncbi:unnamed protein product [Camellia sinensis]